MTETVTETERLRAFVAGVLAEGCWRGVEIDGATLQELGMKHGVLRRVAFDPDIHDDDGYGLVPGDDWCELSWTN